MGKVSKQLVGASAPKIILSILAIEDSYGYEILEKVKELSNGEIKWSYGSIYPVLKKMEASGLIFSDWRIAENERPRKYYRMTEEGKIELQNQKDEWDMVYNVLTYLSNPHTS
jgi:PadR family transcriptional regulator, regulatory protein PadR